MGCYATICLLILLGSLAGDRVPNSPALVDRARSAIPAEVVHAGILQIELYSQTMSKVLLLRIPYKTTDLNWSILEANAYGKERLPSSGESLTQGPEWSMEALTLVHRHPVRKNSQHGIKLSRDWESSKDSVLASVQTLDGELELLSREGSQYSAHWSHWNTTLTLYPVNQSLAGTGNEFSPREGMKFSPLDYPNVLVLQFNDKIGSLVQYMGTCFASMSGANCNRIRSAVGLSGAQLYSLRQSHRPISNLRNFGQPPLNEISSGRRGLGQANSTAGGRWY